MPHVKEDRAMYSDPVTADLVGALIAVRISEYKFYSIFFSLSSFRQKMCKHTSVCFSLLKLLFGQQSPRNAWESRRSSSDSARMSTIRAVTSPANMMIKTAHGSQQIVELLDKCLEWEFDMFKLEVLTERRWRSQKFE